MAEAAPTLNLPSIDLNKDLTRFLHEKAGLQLQLGQDLGEGHLPNATKVAFLCD